MADQERRSIESREQRLEGEPQEPASADEARTWIRMYTHLVEFEEGILAEMRTLAAALPAEVRGEVEASNIRPMEELIADYRDRAKRLQESLISVLPDEEPAPDS
jgi:hypothetical protein